MKGDSPNEWRDRAHLQQIAAEYVPRLQRALDNMLEFWYPHTLDRTHGGFTLNHDVDGHLLGPGTKAIVTQARMTWFFARLARFGRESARYLEAAEHGFRFLTSRLWDETHGGFYWEVDATGLQVLKPHKHLYAQAFGIFALAEYARASARAEPLERATALFELIDKKAHDHRHSGYREVFPRNWRRRWWPLRSDNDLQRDLKRMNTHLHLMEALTGLLRAGGGSIPVHERLVELMGILGDKVVENSVGACTDEFRVDWTRLTGDRARVSYGHDLENIWLLLDACEATGTDVDRYRPVCESLFRYALAYGWDAEAGGFYNSGPLGRPADRLEKIWWVEAEAIVAALRMHRLTGDDTYLDVFARTYDWIETRQIDWQRGEWYAIVRPDGTPDGSKAYVWKAAYHNGRAIIECLQMLEPMMPAAPAGGN